MERKGGDMESARFAKVEVADSFAKKLVGLMGRDGVPQGWALYFPGTASVHSMFMRCAVDVVYLDGRGRMLDSETLAPWRLGKRVKGAKGVLECAEGSAEEMGLEPGEQLVVRKQPGAPEDGPQGID